MKYECNSPKETYEIGMAMGKKAKNGQIYALIGDLGVGKTVFTKGFAKGLEIDEDITSPTFVIVNEYTDGRLKFNHFDVYRIEDPFELEEIGYDEYFYGEGVCLVEWANLIEELMPEETIYITIAKDLAKGLDYRTIEIDDSMKGKK